MAHMACSGCSRRIFLVVSLELKVVGRDTGSTLGVGALAPVIYDASTRAAVIDSMT
jgi:hypothetical protein